MAAVMISRHRFGLHAGSGSQEPSGHTGAVPETKIRSPTRSARENPIVSSYGDPDETRRRSAVTSVLEDGSV